MGQFDRNIPLIGEDAQEKLNMSKVLVLGIGGVGGYVCEALARAGVGRIDVCDGDEVDESNINRQIIATHKTIGKDKVFLIKERMEEINPKIKCKAEKIFYNWFTEDTLQINDYDYVVDAVDDVDAKILIIKKAKESAVPVISSMGTGNKLDPTMFQVKDISETSVCPLARSVRKKLKEQGIEHVKVVYSEENPKEIESDSPASISFVPSVAGLIIAGEVIKDLIK